MSFPEGLPEGLPCGKDNLIIFVHPRVYFLYSRLKSLICHSPTDIPTQIFSSWKEETWFWWQVKSYHQQTTKQNKKIKKEEIKKLQGLLPLLTVKSLICPFPTDIPTQIFNSSKEKLDFDGK